MKHLSICSAVLAILFTFSSSARADSELISNFGFEAGSLSGWNLSGNTGFAFVDCLGAGSFFLGRARSGNCAALLGPIGADGILISDPLPTIADRAYELSFWLANQSGPPNDFGVYWNGDLLTKFHAANPFEWTNNTFGVTAVGDDSMTFRFRQDPGVFGLDDVSVFGLSRLEPQVVTPEPAMLTLLGLGLAGLGICRKRLVR